MKMGGPVNLLTIAPNIQSLARPTERYTHTRKQAKLINWRIETAANSISR